MIAELARWVIAIMRNKLGIRLLYSKKGIHTEYNNMSSDYKTGEFENKWVNYGSTDDYYSTHY